MRHSALVGSVVLLSAFACARPGLAVTVDADDTSLSFEKVPLDLRSFENTMATVLAAGHPVTYGAGMITFDDLGMGILPSSGSAVSGGTVASIQFDCLGASGDFVPRRHFGGTLSVRGVPVRCADSWTDLQARLAAGGLKPEPDDGTSESSHRADYRFGRLTLVLSRGREGYGDPDHMTGFDVRVR